MNELTQVLEKISTLNINADTSIDIEMIVENYVLFKFLTTVISNLIMGVTVLTIFILIFRLVKFGINKSIDDNLVKQTEGILNSFNNCRDVEEINERLIDIQKYIPRNKRAKVDID